MKIKEIVQYLEIKFPKNHASDFDVEHVGFIIGDENIEMNKVLLSLDLNLEVIEEAIRVGANFIITHHPFLFHPLYKILFATETAKIIQKMFDYKISNYAMHTNFDVGINGVNDTLASMIGIENIMTPISSTLKDNFLRYGNIEETSLVDLANHIKDVFQLSGVRVVGELNQKVKKIGVIGGSGANMSEINSALMLGIDCFITGEIKLNIAQYAKEHKLVLIEINHGVEKYAFLKLKEMLETDLELKESVLVSEIETDPLRFI